MCVIIIICLIFYFLRKKSKKPNEAFQSPSLVLSTVGKLTANKNAVSTSPSPLWINPIPPELKGIPQYLLQHPNKYSMSKSQIIIYNSYQDFISTDFYKTYQARIQLLPIPLESAQQKTSTDEWFDYIVCNYGKKWRVIFTQGNTQGQGDVGTSKNFNSYYLDCVNISDYISLLEMLYKDRDDIVPVEATAILRIKHNADALQQSYSDYMNAYNKGHADATAAQEAAAQTAAAHASDDSDDKEIWGDIQTGVELAGMLL